MTEPNSRAYRPWIAIVLPDLGGGGTERVHIELAREFLALGYGVEFVLLRREGALLDDVPQGASVVGLDAPSFRRALMPLRRYLRERRPPFMMAAMWPLTAVAVAAARTVRPQPRVLLSEHVDFLWGSREGRLSTLAMKHLGRRIYAAADAIVCVSGGAKRALAKVTGFPEDRIALIYNPVRPPQEIPSLPVGDDTTWWQAGKARLLSIGRLTEQKDHATLLHAMALLPAASDARLLVLGEGPERANLERMIDTLDVRDRVRLAGFSRAVPAFLRRASLFVLSSRWEGLGNVIVEALLQNIPVVATDCPSGPAEILDGGRFGRLVPVQDPPALASAIVAALADPPAPEGLRERGALFKPARVAREYLRLVDPGFSPDAIPATR